MGVGGRKTRIRCCRRSPKTDFQISAFRFPTSVFEPHIGLNPRAISLQVPGCPLKGLSADGASLDTGQPCRQVNTSLNTGAAVSIGTVSDKRRKVWPWQ